jgi:hypothetical protein
MRGSSELEPLFVGSSTASCSKIERTNEIDCAQNVVGEDAESDFGFDLRYASGEKPPSCRHSFDGSEWVFSGAPPLVHEVRTSVCNHDERVDCDGILCGSGHRIKAIACRLAQS